MGRASVSNCVPFAFKTFGALNAQHFVPGRIFFYRLELLIGLELRIVANLGQCQNWVTFLLAIGM